MVQDSFVYVFGNLHRYDPERGPFWVWLRVVLVSRCRNRRRRKRLRLISLAEAEEAGQSPRDPDPAHQPEAVLEALGWREALWNGLRQVSDGARDALVLRYYEGLSYAEIAEALGCSVDAARARVAYGKVQLRRLLSGAEEEGVRQAGALRVVEVG